MVARALADTAHPVLAQIIPARFCNLSCGYCNEYDKVSEPVPLPEMLRRIDHLGRLGTAMIGISGGEPLTHPQLDEIIRRMRRTGAIAGMITNGYLLNAERIERLNRAGLDHMQISIDNLEPDEISKKSLKVLDKKLEMLAEFAEFHVNINSVVGGGFKDPNDALVIGRRALELGFESTIGIIHDGSGQLKPLNEDEAKVYFAMTHRRKTNYAQFDRFQEAIALGKPNDWRCRAGSRYLYICEDGLVHYCSQQRGYPGVPLAGIRRKM
jgi:MoaA/NifB/PqqE/SkfB family radical SAM enzyme